MLMLDNVRRASIITNYFEGFSNLGVWLAGADIGAGYVIDALIITGNQFNDVGQAVYFNSTQRSIRRAVITSNIFENTAITPDAVVHIKSNRGNVLIDSNVFDHASKGGGGKIFLEVTAPEPAVKNK